MDLLADIGGYLGSKRHGREICGVCFNRWPEDHSLYEHERRCRAQAQHSCSPRLFVTWDEEESKMVRVRPPPSPCDCKIPPGKFFSPCQFFPGRCKRGDRCSYAHGQLELEVWNTWVAEERERHLRRLSCRPNTGLSIQIIRHLHFKHALHVYFYILYLQERIRYL